LKKNQKKVIHYQTKKEKEKAAQHSTYQINTRTTKTNEPKNLSPELKLITPLPIFSF
jgi:hypothetical protein